MNAERAKRRERIAVAIMAGLAACPVHGNPAGFAEDAIKFANDLMAELDKAALADTPDTDPLRQLAELQDLQAGECEKLDALTQFAEAVRAEAEDDDELYGPFVALVRDLDAKVGAK